MARNMGIDKEIEQSQKIMFAAGEAQEDYTWRRRLEAGYPDGKIIGHGEKFEVKFELSNGKLVTGSPDLGITDADGKLLLGLELKGIYGYSTAIAVYCEGRPKNENLIQAGAYSAFLGGVDYALCYTQAGWMPVNFFDQKKYPIKQIKPFDRMFYLRWVRDNLEYRNELKPDWIKTTISKQGIIDYYLLLQEMQDKRELGPRINSHSVDGTENKWGAESNCKYCEFSHACSGYETHKDFDRWIEEIKQANGDSNE